MMTTYNGSDSVNRVYRPCKQRGFTLLEALFAFVILAVGLLAAFRFHSTTMETTAESKLRSEAVALAETKLEELRGFVTLDSFNNDTVAGNGLGDYGGVDYAADFTRSWAINGANPLEIAVTVTWNDRTGTDVDTTGQSIQLTSLVWGNSPMLAASELSRAFSTPGNASPWPDPPTTYGTGHGTGKVTIEWLGDDGVTYLDPDVLPDGVILVSYSIYFTGFIDATDAILTSVSLVTDDGFNGTAGCMDPYGNADTPYGDPDAAAVVSIDADGVTPLDADGVEVINPYAYDCSITGVPTGELWTGVITYDAMGNDAVCIPNNGSAQLGFSESSPATVELGIVVLTNNGACNVL